MHLGILVSSNYLQFLSFQDKKPLKQGIQSPPPKISSCNKAAVDDIAKI
jgi:hypothetical protein